MATILKGKNRLKPYTVRYQHEGRQREKSFRTAAEARDFKVKFEHDSRERIFVDPKLSSEKFSVVAARWFERHQGAPNTHRAYGTALRLHVLPVFGDKALSAVAMDREGFESFLRVTLPGKGLASNTIRVCYLVLTAIVNDALRSGRLTQTRLRGVRPPATVRKASIPFATQGQIAQLAECLPDPYGYTVYLMRGCGLRIGEALGVRREDIASGTLRLTRQAGEHGELMPLKHRGDGEHRDIPVPRYVLDAMPGEWERFEPVGRRKYQAWFNRARDAAGLPATFTPHTLRHAFASVALAGAVPITDVSKWLGHRNIQVTFGIYGHLVPESWDRARSALDAEWRAAPDGP
jgi:integrase